MSYGTTLHIISSCQATASSEIVDRFWASCKQRYIKYPTFTFHVLYDRPSCKFLADAVVTLTTPKTTTLIRRMNTSSSLLMKYQIHATCPEWSSPPPHPQVKHGRHLSNATWRHKPFAGDSGSASEMPWRVKCVDCDLHHHHHHHHHHHRYSYY